MLSSTSASRWTASSCASSIQTPVRHGTLRHAASRSRASGPDKDALTFVVTENYFNGDVTVEAPQKAIPSRTNLVDASQLDLGELFSPRTSRSST